MIGMPGKSFRGPLPPLRERAVALRDALRRDVEVLAGEIGERNVPNHAALSAAADFVEQSLESAGLAVSRQEYLVSGKPCYNLEAEIVGADRAAEIVVIGAHYDSVYGSPGADDNASGVAAVLALARELAGQKFSRTLRFVAFANEEPPYFLSDAMGSLVYARRCRERGERVTAMLSLETIGYYSDDGATQRYPGPLTFFYPSQGNFLAFVGNVRSRALVREAIGSFRRHASFPSEGGAVPGDIPGVGWSDHWSFWQQGYPAIMLTDTAPFRYPHYHTRQDTPDKLDYDRLARVVAGLEGVVADLAGGAPAAR